MYYYDNYIYIMLYFQMKLILLKHIKIQQMNNLKLLLIYMFSM